jgi:hypothetical protein
MVAISQHGTSVLFTSHPQDGLVMNFYIPHNRRTPLQAEEAFGPISIPRGSRGVACVLVSISYVLMSIEYVLVSITYVLMSMTCVGEYDICVGEYNMRW